MILIRQQLIGIFIYVVVISTDLGIMLGSVLRGDVFDKRKAILFLLIIAGFISGGIFGVLLFDTIAFKALLAPAFICLVLALSYRLIKKAKKGNC